MAAIIPLVDISNLDYRQRIPLSVNDVAADHQWTYRQRNMNFDKDLGLKGQYCYHPFNTITVDGSGNVFMCVCQAWLPISVGNILNFNSLSEIVKSANAREIQSSIIDGSYKYCDNNTCSIIKENQLKKRIDHKPDNINWINFSLDYSCNLKCPSCRSEFKFLKSGKDFDYRLKIAKHIATLINDHNHPIKFTLAGDGDPFASLIYNKFLTSLRLDHKASNDVEIEIVTNGILLSAHWQKLKRIHKNIIKTKISFDAGSKDVYCITRGGDWNKLISNVKYIKKWKDKNYSNMLLTSNFVVQASNYKDMVDYVVLCDQLGFDEINFQKIDDWGTFKDFKEHAVWHIDHWQYQDFLIQLSRVESLKNKKVNLTNLSDYQRLLP